MCMWRRAINPRVQARATNKQSYGSTLTVPANLQTKFEGEKERDIEREINKERKREEGVLRVQENPIFRR